MGAFFVVVLITVGSAIRHPPAAATECPLDVAAAEGIVAFVYDGDTIRLTNGERVRLLGIDTPELDHQGNLDEPYADAARTALNDVTPPGVTVKLRFDRVRRDRFGRLLAHVFLSDGSNVQTLLLAQGLAATLVIPPNQWHHQCYASRQRDARAAQRGIWSHSAYQAIAPTALAETAKGFYRVTGTVTDVLSTRNSVELLLDDRLAVRVRGPDLGYFDALDVRTFLHHRVLVNGWVKRHAGRLEMLIRHPSALEILPP